MERISYQELPHGLLSKMMNIENFINASGIELNVLELIRYRVSQINGCAFCVDMHYKEAKDKGETEIRLYSLSVWKDSYIYSDKEKVVLDFTEALTNVSGNDIDDELYNSLTVYFSKNEIAILTLAIAQINSWTRLMKTFKFTPGNYKVNSIKASNTISV